MNSKTKRADEPSDATESFGLEESPEIETDMAFWADADIVVEDGRTRMILYLDSDVYDWFTQQEGDHHAYISEVLRHYMQYVQGESGEDG